MILIHVSDFHFGDNLIGFRDLREKQKLFSKRYIGWLNHQVQRKHQFSPEIKTQVIKTLQKIDWDYLIITGDLATLSLEQEFSNARKNLEPLLKKGTVILTPGNHDRYVKEALKPDLLAAYFGDCFPFQDRNSESNNLSIQDLGDDVILAELDMSVPSCLISSRGKINVNLVTYQEIISNRFNQKLKIAIGHYPAFIPPDQSEGYLHSLKDRKALQEFLLNSNFDLYLHGHIHKSWQFKPSNNHQLVCVNSGGCCRYAEGTWAGFHRITIGNRNIEIEKILVADI